MHSGRIIAYDVNDFKEFKFQEIKKVYLNHAFHIFTLILYKAHAVLEDLLNNREEWYHRYKKKLEYHYL